MKVGILTLPLNNNYGGILQAWALQQVLINMEHEPELIARTRDYPKLSKIFVRNLVSFGKSLVVNAVNGKRVRYLRSPFKRDYNPRTPEYCDGKFVKENILSSPKLSSDKEFHYWLGTHHYDAFIVGSDQIWREEYSPDIDAFFLDFVKSDDPCKKIAYAASFGTEKDYISESKIDKCIENLKKFNAVSVREDGGIKIVKDKFHREDVIKVLDPTLLLSKDVYHGLIEKKDRSNLRFIAAYLLDQSDENLRIVEAISQRKGIPVKIISAHKGYEMLTMSEWLANFSDCEFVVTDSFHGTAFSLIFEKNFVIIANKERGLGRFESLLKMLGLEERLMYGESNLEKGYETFIQDVDYSKANVKIEDLREISLNFLKSGLS